MQVLWQVEDKDVFRVKDFYHRNKDNDLVVRRRELNVEGRPPEFSRSSFWLHMVGCLLTTQQRSGPDSPVSRFNSTHPFPLNYTKCKQHREDLETFVQDTLAAFGGIRRSNKIAAEVHHNFNWLERGGGWHEVEEQVEKLRRRRTHRLKLEITTANFFDDNLKGFEPKQSRNLLQELGLTMYEVPIDSRIARWLISEFGFPAPLSADALSDRNYYRFVSEGIQKLCNACDIYPCLLDAAIFSSYDEEAASRLSP
jgi:hypothetical protein